MNGLEQELRALAPLVEWPDEPDVARAVAVRHHRAAAATAPSFRVGAALL